MDINKWIISFIILLVCFVSASAVSAVDTNDASDMLSTSISDISVSDVSEYGINMNYVFGDGKNNVGTVDGDAVDGGDDYDGDDYDGDAVDGGDDYDGDAVDDGDDYDGDDYDGDDDYDDYEECDTTLTILTKGNVYNGNYYKVLLKDDYNKPLANQIIFITILGKAHTVKTDKNGIAKVKINVANRYTGKPLRVLCEFGGDYGNGYGYGFSSNHNKIKVVKMNTKITKTSAKVVKNHKYFYVKLTTKTGKVMKAKIITIKSNIKGKTYKMKTNANGMGKIKLEVKRKQLGKYYKYTFKFAGNKYYKSCSRTFKIKIVK